MIYLSSIVNRDMSAGFCERGCLENYITILTRVILLGTVNSENGDNVSATVFLASPETLGDSAGCEIVT